MMATHSTITTYQRWPFLPASTHTLEQREQWWEACFTRTPEVMRFMSAEASAVVVGGVGSGKSTAVAALRHLSSDGCLLFVPYSPHHWPGGSRPWVPGGNHLNQILAAAATEITRHLSEKSGAYTDLAKETHSQQFLFWLIETHLGRRTLARLQHRLRQTLDADLVFPETVLDLYATTTRETDVWNQLDELVYLAEKLGYDRIIVTIDLNEAEATTQLNDLRDLFGWLDLFEYPEFVIRAAIPQTADDLLHLTQRGNGRFEVIPLRQNEPVIAEIVNRHIQVATYEACHSLEDMAETAVLERAKVEIERVYGRSALAGWLQWAETLIASLQSGANHDPDGYVAEFYQRHMPLRLENGRAGVWRGPQFIPLDQQPYEFLKKLFALQGQSSPDLLLSVAGSTANLNTLASRLRKEIEPIPGQTLYLQNRRDRGYWLENFAL